jgi:sialate O-acetylesterase
MKTILRPLAAMLCMVLLTPLSSAQVEAQAKTLKLHNIFSSDMVLQRGKPIKIWGWGKPGDNVSVKFGTDTATAVVAQAAPVNVFGEAENYAGKGRWEVTLPEREASTDPQTLSVNSGTEKVELSNIVVGDVWVMHGQSNMAFPLQSTNGRHLAAQANLPHLRLYSISNNEQATLQDDIRPEAVTTGGWVVSSPETAAEFSCIGYVFGSNVQRSVGIPIGLIKVARGGASIESMVPLHKFDEDPLTKRYADHVKARMAAFDPEAEADRTWENEKSAAKRKNQPEPKRPDPQNLRSWNVPGKSPSDMASVHNGYFGVFKGYNIMGVLFHQGYNNTVGDNCRPKRYGKLMKLMVEGWREDFNDPNLAVGIIGFCADGGQLQNEENFEERSIDTGPYIREAQRLGLAEAAGTGPAVFIPGYDVQAPGLHPNKKREHGWRAARWALSEVYKVEGFDWISSKPVSAEPKDDMMVLTFDGRVLPDDGEKIPRGFSIAGEDGRFYLAHARFQPWEKKDARTQANRTIHVWSPLVEKPVAVRYAWGNCPIGNLKCNGDQDIPLTSFRTDHWDLPEEEDPALKPISREVEKERKDDAKARLEHRRTEEAKRALEIIERLKTLGQAE